MQEVIHYHAGPQCPPNNPHIPPHPPSCGTRPFSPENEFDCQQVQVQDTVMFVCRHLIK
jgi:hypothetical protein